MTFPSRLEHHQTVQPILVLAMQGRLIPVFATAQRDCKSAAHIFYVSNIEALTDELSSERDIKKVIIHDFHPTLSERHRRGVWRGFIQSDQNRAVMDQIESNRRKRIMYAKPFTPFLKLSRKQLRNRKSLIPSRPLFGGKS
jgi:hypothetical protein